MRFRVSGYLTLTCVAEVEADSKEEAAEKARELPPPGLCHQCEGAGDGASEWQIGGFDDTPEDCVKHVELIL
jgi:hypothetical protein